jgi:hypothetical protein
MPTQISHPGIIKGFSDPTEADLEKALVDTERERDWYSDVPGFETNADILRAHEAGKLALVRETELYRPATRFLNPDLHHIYPPFLSFSAHDLLEKIAQQWRHHADILGVPDDIRLSITSMTRSIAYQRELVAAGKLAVDDSTHTKQEGGASDADLGGYYQGFGADLKAISLRTPAQQAPIRQIFAEELKAYGMQPTLVGPEYFDPRVPKALGLATQQLHEQGVMNAVEEFPDDPNNCLHMAVNPHLSSLAA